MTFVQTKGVTLATCESGKVWQRLLRWRLRNLQGFVCGSPPGKQTRWAVVVQMWRGQRLSTFGLQEALAGLGGDWGSEEGLDQHGAMRTTGIVSV